MSDSFLFQLLEVCFLVNVLRMFGLDSFRFIELIFIRSLIGFIRLWDSLLCLHYPLKFEDRLLMESITIPRFEICCLNSTVVAGFEMWSDDAGRLG